MEKNTDTKTPETTARCEICDWPLAETAEQGCVPGNCSYRPADGSAEDLRIRARRHELASADASQGRETNCEFCGQPLNEHGDCDFDGPVHNPFWDERPTPSHTGTAESDDAVSQDTLDKWAAPYFESDDAALFVRLSDVLREVNGNGFDFETPLRALARRATTMSETDGAALQLTEVYAACEAYARTVDSAGGYVAMQHALAAAALARTPAADGAGEKPLVARACLLQTRGQHPHTALPCTQCHFGPCEVCL